MNRMTNLLNKIERRLGTAQLNLPDYLTKDKWGDVVKEDSLVTYSRYFPNKITITIDENCPKKDGYYLIDYYLPESVEVLGVRDLNWSDYSKNSASLVGTYGGGAYNYLQDYSLDSVMQLSARADVTSLFNNGIYIDYKPGGMIRFVSVNGFDVSLGSRIPLDVLITHSDNLATIPPTSMELFESLAQADVAIFLYNNLKYYEGLETVYTNIDIKLSDLEKEADKRDGIIDQLKDGYVSAANFNQPIMFTV